MKQLKVLSIALLALGVCTMNADGIKEVSNFLMYAYSNNSDTDSDPFTDQNATPTPAEKALKGKTQPQKNQTDTQDPASETEDLNNDATDSDED